MSHHSRRNLIILCKRVDVAQSGSPRYSHHHVAPASGSGNDLIHDAAAVNLDDLGLVAGQSFLYRFDFDDDWWHELTVLEIGQAVPLRKYPRVAARYGVSPPQYGEE